MRATDVRPTRRLNLVISDALVECLTTSAHSQGITVSAFVRRAVERECERAQEETLAHAADALADLYRSDKELTAFVALDGEPIV
jgi:hypothetical protein